MKRFLLTLALLLLPSLASAQCNGVFPANTLCGNLTGSPAPPSAFTASTIAGPGPTVVGDIPTWANTLGSQLSAGIHPPGNTTTFLRGDSTFANPLNNTLTATGSTTARTPSAFFGDWLTVKDFGAVGDGVTNDTTAIQLAIDTSCPSHLVGVSTQIFPIIFPAGTYMVSQLNATNCNAFTVWGQGIQSGGAIIQKIAGVNVNAVFDMTGSLSGCQVHNIYIKASLSDGDTPYPNHGILFASSLANNGVGNFCNIENLSVAGRFGVAAVYMYGLCCSTITAMGTQQAHPSNTNGYAWVLSATNIVSAFSAFTTIMTGNQGASDIACYRCEMHAFTGGGAASGHALFLEGALNFTYDTGLLASASPNYTVITQNNNTNLTFQNTTWYTDVGPLALNALGSALAGTIRNLVLINPNAILGAGGALTNFAGFMSGHVEYGQVSINAVTSYLHTGGIGTAPAVSACGGGAPQLVGSDEGGVVLENSAVTTCTITFATAYSFNRACTVTPQTAGAVNFGYTVSATQIVVSHNNANLAFNYTCNGF